MNEKIKKKITLEAEDIDREVLKNFVDYLSTGEIRLEGKNVMSMLRLAQQHLVSHLACACLKFIGENLDIDTFKDLLSLAFESDNDDLKWQCFIYAYKNGEENNFLALLDSEEISEEGKRFLRWGIQCSESSIEPYLSDDGQRIIKLRKKNSITEEAFDVLKQMNKECRISGFDIGKGEKIVSPVINPISILRKAQKLVSFLNLSFIKFMGENFEISTSKNLLQCVFDSKNDDLNWRCLIYAFNNSKEKDLLTLLNSEEISEEGKRFLQLGIQCNKFGIEPSLSDDELRMIKLSSIKLQPNLIEGINVLKQMNKKFTITNLKLFGPHLTDKDLKNLVSVFQNLDRLSLHMLKETTIPSTWLKSLKEIDCVFCSALTSIDAPNAEKIDCKICSALTSIDAPNAEKIDCFSCSDLTSIDAPNAEKITIKNCYKLKSLTVAENCKIIGDIPKECEVVYVPRK